MTDRFLGTWTLRGVFKVGSDIFLLPGDKFRVDKADGKYQIVMLEGDKRWSSAVDLVKMKPGDTLFDRSRLQPRNSEEFTQNEAESRYLTVLRPVWTAVLAAGNFTHLSGPVPDIGADVELYVGYDGKEEVIIVRVKHGGSQNGHGSRRSAAVKWRSGRCMARQQPLRRRNHRQRESICRCAWSSSLQRWRLPDAARSPARMPC